MLLKVYMKVNISLLQIKVVAGNIEKNFETVINYLMKLPEKNYHFAVLPELWASGYSYENIDFCAKYTTENIYKLEKIAFEKNLNIIGSVPYIEKNNLYNRNLFINNKGEIASYYNKIHLFKPLKEDKYFKKGEKICFVKDPIPFGLTLCYDLRFPELFRILTIKGALIIFISAQWPKARLTHWKILNIARAIENQIFIVSCNCVGFLNEIEFGGNSMIVNPDGEILAELSNNEEIFSCIIETDEINKSKSLFDIKKDITLI